jgi:hypothetical protein
MLKSLSDINAQDLVLIEDLAGLFFTPKKIALMVEISATDMHVAMLNEESDIYIAFQKGRLQKEVDLRRSILKLANAGSSPAQTMSLDIFNKSKAEMLDT